MEVVEARRANAWFARPGMSLLLRALTAPQNDESQQ
jgi:hypothetical protein